MGNIKRNHQPLFKSKVALELIKGNDTISSICSRYNIHPTQARRWKDQAMSEIIQAFTGKGVTSALKRKEQLIEELYKQVGRLKVELDWLEKKLVESRGSSGSFQDFSNLFTSSS